MGKTNLSPGVHHDVKIKLDPKRLERYGYLENSRQEKVAVTVDAVSQGNSHAQQVVKAIELCNASPDPS